MFTVLALNPKAASIAVSNAALYIHFREQSAFVVDMMERKIEQIEGRGEEAYNRQMIAGIAPVPLALEPPLPNSQPV